uniref:Potassium channel domain-containing protein n=1 Tax=Globodera rostochiensis TaxID=31243 RepID=A0A914GXN9_GLORO
MALDIGTTDGGAERQKESKSAGRRFPSVQSTPPAYALLVLNSNPSLLGLMLYQRRPTYEMVQPVDEAEDPLDMPGTSSAASDDVSRRKISSHRGQRKVSRRMELIVRGSGGWLNAEDTFGELNEGMEPDELEELRDRLGDLVDPRESLQQRRRRLGVFDPSSVPSHPSSVCWTGGHSSMVHHASLGLNGEEDAENEVDDVEGVARGDSALKKYAKLILPHVALVLLTCAYTIIGAFIFYSVENPHEIASKRRQLDLINRQQDMFVSALVRLAVSNVSGVRDEWQHLARGHLHEMSDHLFIAFEKHFLTATEVKRNATISIWTFSTAVFFSVTVVSTIGYGNPVPVTRLGRIACISFSLFGIPLTLVTIADLGKFLSEHLVWLYGRYLGLKHFVVNKLQRTEFEGEHICGKCRSRGLSTVEGSIHLVEEKKIPALLVLAILVLYTALGGVLMSQLEPWSFFTSFYWSFITMTTVGFGDLMPRREHYTALILLYIVLGLAITTMCIDLVGIQYIRKIHYFGRKIQDARSALAVVGGKVVLVSELYTNLVQKRQRNNTLRDAFIIENLYVSKRHIIPFIPSDIRLIKYIDQIEPVTRNNSLSDPHLVPNSCRFCHSHFGMANHHI